MDRTAIIVLIVCFALLVLWFPLMNSIYPPQPRESAPTEETEPTEPKPEATEPAAPRQPPSTTTPAKGTSYRDHWEKGEAEEIRVETEQARFTFTSHGGGLKTVELKDHPQQVQCGSGSEDSRADLVTLNAGAAFPILSLQNPDEWESDEPGVFNLKRTREGVVAEKALSSGVRLTQEFELGTNYFVTARFQVRNPTDEPVAIPAQPRIVGTSSPVSFQNGAQFQGVFWHNEESTEHIGESYFANRTLGCIPGTPRTEYSGGSNITWAAVHNRFFTILAMLDEPGHSLHARRVPLSMERLRPDASGEPQPTGYQTALVYPDRILEPSETMEKEWTLYVGPKKYSTLAKFDEGQDQIMDFGFVGIFSKILLASMNGLFSLGLSYGWAIVTITVIIKLLFWPLTRAGTRSMKRMQALQPEMKALQEKYKDDPQKMNQKLMEFMKRNKVNPLGGCLPMLVQMPVFIGFLFMIKSAVELRGAPFLWICDLSSPDTVWTIPGIGFPLNPMPILMGVTMLWQMRLTPSAPGMDPTQQKIMKYMPMVIVVFLYNFSSGMTLYWTVQNILTVVQTKMTKTADEKAAQAGAQSSTPAPTPAPVPGSKKKKKKKKN